MIGLPYGELSERFKEPVLKTGDAATHREFESHTLRQKIPHPKGVWYFLASWRFEPSNPTVQWTVGVRLLPHEPLFLQRTLQKCNRISTLRPPPIKQKPPINESPAYPPTFEQGESNRISTLRRPPIKQKPLFKDSSIYPPTFVTGTQKCNRISTLRCPFFHSTFYASSPRHPCTKNPIVL